MSFNKIPTFLCTLLEGIFSSKLIKQAFSRAAAKCEGIVPHMALKLSFKCHLIFLQINVLSTLVNKKVLENIQIQYSAYLQRGQTSAKCLIKNMNPL